MDNVHSRMPASLPPPAYSDLTEPPTLYIGIDPGLNGAIAFYWPTRGVLEVVDMPTYTVESRGKKKRHVNARALAGILRARRPVVWPVRALVERVNAAPIQGRRQGTTSMFNFGDSSGVVRGVLAGLDIPYERIAPTKWKRAVGLPPGAEKSASRDRAASVFPAYASTFKRQKDDGRADAALLAFYDATKGTDT